MLEVRGEGALPLEVPRIERGKLNFAELRGADSAGATWAPICVRQIVAGNCNVIQHKIELTDSRPIKQTPRRIPLHLRAEVDKIIEGMKEQGVIEESQSPWVSPAVMVKKKDGTIRFCVDYRKLNDVTVKDSYPLPRIDDILDQLAGNTWFTTLDLKSGYWQVSLASKDKEKTAFSIGRGLWQFTVMPFGLYNAPATFERLMEKVLHGLLMRVCFVYLDDVIIYGKTFEEMLENLRKVFQRIRAANLKVNPKKCAFLRREVKYLGHVASAQGIVTDPEKISAVVTWPPPRTRKQVQDGAERVIAYFSRVFSKTERNYCITRRELLAVVDAVKSFHHYLYGRRSGKAHTNADRLSRRPYEEAACRYCEKVESRERSNRDRNIGRIVFSEDSRSEWRTDQLRDSIISMFVRAKEIDQRPSWQEIAPNEDAAKIYWSHWDALILEGGVLYKRWVSSNPEGSKLQIIVPRGRIAEILEEAHDSPTGGHFGVNKTLAKIRQRYYWATCKSDVEDWCAS
ncbi:uncharacterized protein LOC109611168 [Ooceraea biroi]|uniref:uncharacterized protein LOC109611168 n=1 Tax=Ooceraea biroi TaxID=2015173 RepID=UPI0009716ED5|nr:uncharacterized protein LOC109611168 [Ooceraea biroi]